MTRGDARQASLWNVLAALAIVVSGCRLQSDARLGAEDPASAAAEARLLALETCEVRVWGATPRTGVFRGIYRVAFEMSDFQPDGSECRWWLRGSTEDLAFTVWRQDDSGDPYEPRTAHVEVEGTLSGPGRFGHGGGSPRELVVLWVISASVPDASGAWRPLTLVPRPTPTMPGPLSPEKLRP